MHHSCMTRLLLHPPAFAPVCLPAADFEINKASITITARAICTSSGKVALSFSGPRLAATINGSGLCTIFGFDLCLSLIHI